MTEQEMQALFDKLRNGITLTNDEMIALARNSGYMAGQFKRLETSVNDFSKDLKRAGDELPAALLKGATGATRSLGGLAKSLGDAETGFRQLTPIIDAAAAAFSTVPILGGMVKATAEASKFMINQLQSATDAFQEVAKVGGLTATGMSGLQQQFLASGMQLKSYTKTIGANSAALANFAGSVGEGAEKFSRTAGTVQKQFGLGLQRLGYGIDEIGETTATYIAQQTRLGLAQGKSNEVLAAGAAKYALELDELSKLTGASKEELKKQQDAAMSEARFRAKLDQLVSEGKVAEAENLKKTQALISLQSAEMGRAFRDASTGFVGTSDESKRGFMATGGALTELAKRAETADPTTVLEEFRSSVKETIPVLRSQALFGNEYAGTYSQLSDFANGIVRDGKAVSDTQKTQQAGGDKLTDQTVSAQKNMQELSIQIQKLGFTYMPAAATAVNSFTGALNKLLKVVSKEVGAPDVSIGGGAGGTTRRNMTPAQQRQAQIDQRIAEAQAAALSGSTTGSTGNLGAGPVFGAPDTTRADRVQVTLDEIREELKKLVKLGGIPGAGASGQAQVQAALTEHDHAHPHPPSADVSPELSAKIGTLVNPLEKMSQTSGFVRNDGKTMHGAIDLAGKIGDKVMAPISGVAKVLSDPKGYGNYVEVTDTITGVKHILAHLDKTMVKTGDVIKAGTQVGTVGNTGMSTGPHLHHEVRLPDGTKVDPSKFYAGAKRSPGGGGGATDMSTYMRTVAMLESGGNPNVKAIANGVPSSAGGLYGFLESSWKGLGGTNAQDRFDPAKSTEMMAKFSAQQKTQLEKNLGRGVSGADMYLGHFMGAGGATKFLGARDRDSTQSAAKLDPAAAASNKSIYYNKEGKERSVEEVYQLMTEKYRKQEANVLAGNIPALVAGITGTGTLAPGSAPGMPTASTLATPRAPTAAPAYTAATAGLAGQGQNVISSGLSAITTALFGGGAQGAPGTADAGLGGGGSETVALLSQLVALSRDQNSNLSKILSASTA
jgi:murein DD-endopeptidase MepM/ murein hydrolase activator NlpD